MKIKDFFIHLLGGMTVEECRESDSHCFDIGEWVAYNKIVSKMESLHGVNADKWAKEVWDFVNERKEELMATKK